MLKKNKLTQNKEIMKFFIDEFTIYKDQPYRDRAIRKKESEKELLILLTKYGHLNDRVTHISYSAGTNWRGVDTISIRETQSNRTYTTVMEIDLDEMRKIILET